MGISQVYDQGQTFPPSVLDIEEKQLMDALASAIKTVTTVSLALNYPTLPSVMHTLVNGYKKVLAVAIETEYSWPGIEELKDRIANPDAYASTAPAAGAGATEAAAPAEEEKAKEESEAEESGEEGRDKFEALWIWIADLNHRFWWTLRLDQYVATSCHVRIFHEDT